MGLLTSLLMWPLLGTECQWGDLVQNGPVVIVQNGRCWDATGSVQADKKTLQLCWTHLDSGRIALGEYEIDGQTLRGHWHWLGDETKFPEMITCK